MSSNNITVSTTSNKITVTTGDGKSKVLTATPIGIQGVRGNTGQRGNTGNTGISISGATLENYNLILTFSDGITVNVGYIRGATGPTGISGGGGCGGSLETLTPSPAGYYPYASIFVDPYGRVTGASGGSDIASQITLNAALALLVGIQSTFTGGVVGGTW